VLIDQRGVFVSLSHYCPTAANLLFDDDGVVAIVEGPPVLPEGEPEGLDARDVLPPLLVGGRWKSNVLMDYEGYSAWEAHMVAVLTRSNGTADDALLRLDRDLAEVQTWRPGRESLAAAIARLLPGDVRARKAVESREPRGEGGARDGDDRVVRRYLAARAFACWAAYQEEDGIGAVNRVLRHALSVLRQERRHLPLKEAIRQTDLQVVHLARRET
jgi:hypothetical protein